MTGFDFDFSKAAKATKKQARLRMALHGASGAGKTYSALAIGSQLGERVFLLDTEFGSASKYADYFDFQTLEQPLPDFHPERLISFFEKGPDMFDVLIVDSMTHFWNAQRGFLELVDEVAKKAQAKGGKFDSFGAWKSIDPLYRRLVYSIHACRAHVIVTLRAKQEYAKEEGDNGKSRIKKVGLAPQMRDEFQYEMDVEGMLNIEHDLVIGKTRCPDLDGGIFNKPGKNVADVLKRWLNGGAPAREMAKPAPQAEVEPEWFHDVLTAITYADNQDQLKEAQERAAKHKADMTPAVRAKLIEAVNDAKGRLAAAQ